MAVTEQDISALQHLAYRIREDTHGLVPWDRQGTHVIFKRELLGKHLLTAIETVVAHASDPEAKTPAAITRPFLPKHAAGAPVQVVRLGANDRCSTCSESKPECRRKWTGDHEFVSEAAARAASSGRRPT